MPSHNSVDPSSKWSHRRTGDDVTQWPPPSSSGPQDRSDRELTRTRSISIHVVHGLSALFLGESIGRYIHRLVRQELSIGHNTLLRELNAPRAKTTPAIEEYDRSITGRHCASTTAANCSH